MIVMDDLCDSYRCLSDCRGVDRPFEAIRRLLLDFDWAGRIGEARYPMNLNRSEGLRRPDGACDGALILADHDIEMLEFIITQ